MLGWVVCVLDYRLSPIVRFPTQLIDLKHGIAFLRRHGSTRYQANSDYIVAAGESAGGHLAALVALTSCNSMYQPGFEDVDTSVKACIDLYGVHDFTDRHGLYYKRIRDHRFIEGLGALIMQNSIEDAPNAFEEASPLYWIRKYSEEGVNMRLPPFFVAHGVEDALVPCADSALFVESIHQYRNVTSDKPIIGDVYLEFPHASHQFHYMLSPRSLALGHAVCAFLTLLHGEVQYGNTVGTSMDEKSQCRIIQAATTISPSLLPSKSKL